jgi:hypothetical protein
MLSFVMVGADLLIVRYAECCCTKCSYIQLSYAECPYIKSILDQLVDSTWSVGLRVFISDKRSCFSFTDPGSKDGDGDSNGRL